MHKTIVVFVLTFATCALALAQGADLVAVLKSDAPLFEKSEACRMLARVGGPEAVPVLAALLNDEQLAHFARGALEPMPFPEAGDALRAALSATTGRLKVGVINSLATRKDTEAVPELAGLLADADADIAQAAADALGIIGGAEAAKALQSAITQPNVSPGNIKALCDGLLHCAEQAAQAGQPEEAAALYDWLLEASGLPPVAQAAALCGAALARGEKGLPLLTEAMRGDDPVRFAAALRAAREIEGGDAVTAALADLLPSLAPDKAIQLLSILGDRGGAAAGPAVLAQAGEGAVEVRVAAISALARIAYDPAIDPMAQWACSDDEEVAKAARNALCYFPNGKGRDGIRAMLKSENPEIRTVAVELVGAGGLENPAALLMKAAQSDDAEPVRLAALKGLQGFAGMDEMPALIEILLTAGPEAETQAAEKALSSLSERQKRMPGAVEINKAVYGALPGGPMADVTDKVAEIVKSGGLSVDASNANFGDTAPGLVKALQVEYTVNGVPVSKSVAEGQTLDLTTLAAPPTVVDAFCTALVKANEGTGAATRAPAVLRLLGATGSPKALEAVSAAASGGDGPVRDTALRALCDWPSPDGLPAVADLFEKATDPTIKMLALRGTVRLLGRSALTDDELVARYDGLMKRTTSPDEKKAVLSGLAGVRSVRALEMACTSLNDEAVKGEALQAAISIASGLGKDAREEQGFFNGKDLTGWEGPKQLWSCEDGAIVGGSKKDVPKNTFIWSNIQVGDFYLALDVKLEPNTANGGIQFRSAKADDSGQAVGYQADMGQDVWGRLYHEHGRGKLFWKDRAEKAVQPGEWNTYEILAVGPAIWTAINGTLGVALLDPEGERSGGIAVQIHAGPPMKASYRIKKLVHNPAVELAGMNAEALFAALEAPEKP